MVLSTIGSLTSSISCEMRGLSPVSSPADSASDSALRCSESESGCTPCSWPRESFEFQLDWEDDRGPYEYVTLVADYLDWHVWRSSHGGPLEPGEFELSRFTRFQGSRMPSIPLDSYICRIAKYGKCSLVCFVMAIVYMERLAKKDAAYRLSALNTHRLILTGVLLAAKLTDDDYFNNAYYARIGGISTAELNRLEVEMLKLLDFQLSVSVEEVDSMLRIMRTMSHMSSVVISRDPAQTDAASPCDSTPEASSRHASALLVGEGTVSGEPSVQSAYAEPAQQSAPSAMRRRAPSHGDVLLKRPPSKSGLDSSHKSGPDVMRVAAGRRVAPAPGPRERGSSAAVEGAEQDILEARRTSVHDRCCVDDRRPEQQHVAQEPVAC